MDFNEPDLTFDVVIIGAGISGLNAAYTLFNKDSGVSFVVIEAKERIGGRTIGQELKCANGTDMWDLGGQWLGSSQPHVMKLVKELDLEVFEQYTDGMKVMQLSSNAVTTYLGDVPSLKLHSLIDLHLFIRRIEKLRKSVPSNDPCLCAKAKEWDSMTLAQALDKWIWTQGAKEAVAVAGRTVFGVEPCDMSFLYYLMYVQAAGGINPLISAEKNSGQQYRVKGGAFQISHRLAEKIGRDKIHLKQPASHIVQNDQNVVVTTTSGRRYKCERLIMAIPPHQAAKLEYSPPLPVEKQYVLQRMPVGYLTKIIVTYKTAFWRSKGFSGEFVTNGGPSRFETCEKGPLCIGYDVTTSKGNPALLAFIGGDQQIYYSELQPEQRKEAVLQSLAEFFGPKVFEYIDYYEKNWNEEPYNGGCPVSAATPGVISHIVPGLRYPFKRIHFAGTESATVWCGFFNGAVEAGQRAAHEVLYNIRPSCLNGSDIEDTYYNMSNKKPLYCSSHLLQTSSTTSTIFYRIIIPATLVTATFVIVRKVFMTKDNLW